LRLSLTSFARQSIPNTSAIIRAINIAAGNLLLYGSRYVAQGENAHYPGAGTRSHHHSRNSRAIAFIQRHTDVYSQAAIAVFLWRTLLTERIRCLVIYI
jgi:hypothetical protein